MQSSEEEIDAKVGDEDSQESQHHEKVLVSWLPQPRERSAVHGEGINEHGDECPHFFRVPSPIASPAYICPDGTDEDARREKEQGGVEEELGEQVHFLGFLLDNEGIDATGKGDAEESVCHHHATHMNAEQRRGQHWHDVGDFGIHLSEVAHEQEEA